MAESTVEYGGWCKEFEVGEFSVFWLIMETVFDQDKLESGSGFLDARLQDLIDAKYLGEDWYHGIELDDVIGADVSRFHELLGDCVSHVMALRSESLWSSLKRSEQAYKVGHRRYGEPANLDALVGLIVRVSLPFFSPLPGDPLMGKLGWFKLNLKAGSSS